ncbi:hypothetical protein CDL15_Pgr022099 [Punica granatum]|nr:hypothetical protein CDL15_Pgr022099 [Punica granatum]
MNRVGSDRIGLPARKRKPPGREAGPDWSVLGLNGPRPVNRRAVGIAGIGGDEAAGGGSRPWTSR